MKYFSTPSAKITLVRKDGFYLPLRSARYVAEKISVVLELSEAQEKNVARRLSGFPWGIASGETLTSNEEKIVNDFLGWYLKEDVFNVDSDGPGSACPSFLLVNLNRGYSLVISERKEAEKRPFSTLFYRDAR